MHPLRDSYNTAVRRLRDALILITAALSAACSATSNMTPYRAMTSLTPNDVELHHQEYGSGAPLLLIHGFGASTYSWRHLVPELAKHHRVILLDLRGFGRSPKPRDDRYSIHHQAQAVARFIRKHELRDYTLFGHSFGGGVALVTTLDLSSDARYKPLRLILIDSVAYNQALPGFIRVLQNAVLGPVAVSLIPDRLQVRYVLGAAYYDDSRITAEAVTEYARALAMPGGKHALLQVARRLIPADIDDIAARYPSIRIPTLILWGRQDEIVPIAVGTRLHQNIPASRFVALDHCGHVPHEECPDYALPVIAAFLNDTAASR